MVNLTSLAHDVYTESLIWLPTDKGPMLCRVYEVSICFACTMWEFSYAVSLFAMILDAFVR